jgi:hypothetical protein
MYMTVPGRCSGDFSIEVGRNVIHGSDAVESAQRELSLWFPEGLVDHKPVLLGQVRVVVGRAGVCTSMAAFLQVTWGLGCRVAVA